MKSRTGLKSMLAVLAVLLLPSMTFALETAEKNLELEFPVEDGASLRIENLLGSVGIRMLRDPGPVRVEARVVSEGKSEEDAAVLLAGVELIRSNVDGVATIHVAYPLESAFMFRAPKEGLKGIFSRWTAGLMRRGNSAVEYAGREVMISKDRKAAGLAVHLTVRVPADMKTSVRQAVGSIDVRFVRGDLEIETDGGSVEVVSCFGNLHVSAAEADVRVASLQGGSLKVESGGGLLDLQGIRTGKVELSSSAGTIEGANLDVEDLIVHNLTGDITFEDLVPVNLDIRTGSGDIDIAFRIRKARNASIRSDSGDVVLRMNERLSFGLTAETKKGEVQLLGMNMELLEQDGMTSRYRAGSGGVDVTVNVPGGELTVRPYGAKTIDLLSKR